MRIISSIRSVELSNETLLAYEQQMRDVHPAIEFWATEAYGKPAYRQFRVDFFAGSLDRLHIPNIIAAKIESLKSLESPLVQHNLRMVRKIAAKYYLGNHYRIPGIDQDDFIQEGCLSIMDCIYAYDGSSRFSNYIHWSLNNRFMDYVRTETPLSSIGPSVLENVQQIQEYMLVHEMSFDNAVVALHLSAKQVINCRRAMANVYSESTNRLSHEKATLSRIPATTPSPQLDYDDLMMRAVQTANLNPLEQLVFQGYMTDDTGYQTRIAKEVGKTRAAVSAAFVRAKKKIRDQYEILSPKKSEAA